MKLSELIKKLAALPQACLDCEVVLQKDAEGNGYSPLHDIDANAIYIADSTWSGEVMSLDWSANDACMDEDEWATYKQDKPRCIVFAPVN